MAKKKKKSGLKMGFTGTVLSVGGLLTAIVFVPTTIFLFFAMLPTIVITAFDQLGKGGTRGLTIGAMNLAGCTPFLIDLWTKSHSASMAITLITDPRTIIVIYCAAGAGYLIDWAMTGIVSTMMVQRGGQRLKDIDKKKKAMVERWGEEVTGLIPLDEHGFPISKEALIDKNRQKK